LSQPPFEDSKDFTEDEAASAVAVATPKAMVESLNHLNKCLFCQKALGIAEQSLKRLSGVHYSKVKLLCVEDHVEYRVFRLGWLNGEKR
jgi:hypothetical protein